MNPDETSAPVLRQMRALGRLGKETEICQPVAYMAAPESAFRHRAAFTIDGGY